VKPGLWLDIVAQAWITLTCCFFGGIAGLEVSGLLLPVDPAWPWMLVTGTGVLAGGAVGLWLINRFW
jgi:hypothetical protein